MQQTVGQLLELVLQQQRIISNYERVCQSMLDHDAVLMDPAMPFYERIEQLERQLIITALHQTGGNVKKASEQLQIVPKTMYNKIRQYHLETHTATMRPSVPHLAIA